MMRRNMLNGWRQGSQRTVHCVSRIGLLSMIIMMLRGSIMRIISLKILLVLVGYKPGMWM